MDATHFELIARIEALHEATQAHRKTHGCGAYSFTDGAALRAIIAEHSPHKTLELGTALGFTSACMALASPESSIDTIEGDPEHARLARKNLRDLGFGARVTVHNGDFENVLEDLTGPYDLAFFDGFAPSRQIIEAIRARLGPESVLVCANLGLAGGSSGDLAREFQDASRWRPLGVIEQGGTAVLRKISAHEYLR